MSFRQFPATDANGENYVIIEFREEAASDTASSAPATRYELADGRHLVRDGRQFRTSGGELTLTT
ncbi:MULTISPECIES: hypothetical protein [Stenotrophomonas]|jgi:hypothetical protein|uniref:Uncharacterized protein n=1 Tax=Stenotrophomonas maltophilia TaxID=40324 RepID=A0A4S2CVR9_STEMA|nr:MULTISPECIES: hypothetical protein [Stenotrophomonas]MBD3825560.1 hypothetical protein [Stenotrophomonas sp.]QIO87881.1 hypothetical protein G9274_001566 [Stenotrophomonas rhizophila]TGY33058.1 hypothetical protein E5352_14100 [Stenotrophomonas maltophilia]HBS64150.1 hypothetical protein [Stenotrophomonas sp.]